MAVPTTAVIASDQITRDGALAYLHSSKRVRVLPPASQREAEVAVLFTTRVTETTLCCMRAAAEGAAGDQQVVLVADFISDQHLLRALKFGLVSFLPRSQTGMDQVLEAVLSVKEGRARLPDFLVRSLIEQINAIRRDILEPSGTDPSGLKEREIEVLRLLAEGQGTAKIAGTLNYSERTIKNILSGMMLRLRLRNRAHAISYAIRAGAL